MIILLVVWLSNIIWILVYNINWILEDWCVWSYGLKHNLVLPKYFISNPSYMMTTSFDMCHRRCIKSNGILLWSLRWNHQYGRHPSVEGTHLVSCTTSNLTISSHEWLDLYRMMLRFMFRFRIQSPLGLTIQIYPNQVWSANYWYRNIISTHTNGYVMLGLCVKPCVTSSHYFTTLWICESIVLPLRKHCEEKPLTK